MNDFTKEELKIIRYSLYHDKEFPAILIKNELLKKIESIIDNYCEHEECLHEIENKKHIFHQDGECGKLFMRRCKKCNIFFQ